MFRCIGITDIEGSLQIRDHQNAAIGECLQGGGRTRQRRQLHLYLLVDRSGQLRRGGHEHHLGLSTVFRLSQQIGRDEIGAGCGIGNHQHFRRARGQIERRAFRIVCNQHFRRSDPRISGAIDLVDFGNRSGAEGEGADGLCTSDLENLGDSAAFRHAENRWIRRSITLGRRT